MTNTKKKPRGRPFAPGQTGNAGGRPKGLAEFRLAARRYSKEGLRILARIMRSKEAAATARVHAVSELFDRAWGKPVQDLAVQGSMAHVDVSKERSATERREWIRGLAFLLAEGAHRAKREDGARER